MFSAGPAAGQVVPLAAPVVAAAAADQPRITKLNPAGGATNIKIDAFVSGEVFIPNGGVDLLTLTKATVNLKRTSDGALVPAVLNTSGGGDVVILKPENPLEPNTGYTFTVTAGLKDLSGASFAPLTSTFTTAAPVVVEPPAYKFEQVQLPTTNGQQYSAIHVQGDVMYAATLTGMIYKFPLNADGTLGTPQVIETVRKAEGGDRFIVGLTVDPSTWTNKTQHVLWISHTGTSGLRIGDDEGEDFTGKISKISGTNLERIEDKVIHLPRSVRDHLTNQLLFNPRDKKIYFGQSSNTAMGAPDKAWGMRKEHLLSGTILKLDPDLLGAAPLDAHTEDASPYDPYAPGAPLTIYATGVRNAYDLTFHPNGRLYAPTNGSAAGGATPAGGGVPGIPQVTTAETDALYAIRPGEYYGHPNPTQGPLRAQRREPDERGRPVRGPAVPGRHPAGPEVGQAGVRLRPAPVAERRADVLEPAGGVRRRAEEQDPRRPVQRRGRHHRADARVERAGHQERDRDPRADQLNNPVDIIEHWGSGNLYVTEFGEKASEGKITLLRPTTKDPEPLPEPPPVGPPAPPPAPTIVLSQPSASIAENKSAAGPTVKLSAAPAADVTITVAAPTGDGDVTVTPASLVFTPANWETPQPLTLAAVDDADAKNGSASFVLSASGMAPVTLVVDEIDDDLVTSPPVPPAPPVPPVPPVPPTVPPPVPPAPPPVEGPAVDLVAEVARAVVPTSVASQTRFKGSLAIRVTNAGDLPLGGLVPVSVRLTAGDTAKTSDEEVFRTFKSLRLKPGQAKTLKFTMPMLPDVAPGDYRLSVILDPENAIVEKSDANNSAVSAGTYAVAAPFTDVGGTYRAAPTGLAIGKAARATLDLTNGGNVVAAGRVNVQVFASSDNKGDGGDRLLATVPVKLKLSPGRAKAVKLKVLLPADLPTGSYFLIARVDVGDMPDPVKANNDASTGPLAL
jgi:hypothetical protein